MSQAVVIGAGVIGLCAARELRRRDWDVVVIDGRRPGSGASHGNAGWVVPGHSAPVPAPGLVRTSLRWMLRSDSPLYIRPRAEIGFARWLFAFWRACNTRAFGEGQVALAKLNYRTFDLFDELEREGLEFEQRREGLIFAYAGRAGLEHDLRDLAALRPYGYETPAVLDGDAVRALEPALTDREHDESRVSVPGTAGMIRQPPSRFRATGPQSNDANTQPSTPAPAFRARRSASGS